MTEEARRREALHAHINSAMRAQGSSASIPGLPIADQGDVDARKSAHSPSGNTNHDKVVPLRDSKWQESRHDRYTAHYVLTFGLRSPPL